MATATVWSGVQMNFESARGTALPLSTPFVTNANPGVVTSTAHGLTNGAYVLMLVEGMTEIDARIFRVANVTANTFELEGENTTDYATCTAGNAYALTFATSISTVTDVSVSGGEPNFVPTTTVHSTIETQVPTTVTPLVYSFTNIWDPGDSGLIAMKTALQTKSQKGTLMQFSGGQIVLIFGYPACVIAPAGSGQQLVSTSSAITASNLPTSYAV